MATVDLTAAAQRHVVECEAQIIVSAKQKRRSPDPSLLNLFRSVEAILARHAEEPRGLRPLGKQGDLEFYLAREAAYAYVWTFDPTRGEAGFVEIQGLAYIEMMEVSPGNIMTIQDAIEAGLIEIT